MSVPDHLDTGPATGRQAGRPKGLSRRAQFAQALRENDDLFSTLHDWLEGWTRMGGIALMHLEAGDPNGMAYAVRRGQAYFDAARNTAREIEAQFAKAGEAA